MASSFTQLRLSLLLVVALGVGCKKSTPNPDAATPAPPVTQNGLPATEEEAREFGQKLEKAVAAGDKAEVENLFRIIPLFERSMSDLDLTANEKQSMLAGAKQAGAGVYSDLIIQVVKAGGSYSVLRVRNVDGRPHVLVRLLQADGAMNYHDFTLARYPDGQIATEDLYISASGEPLTQTFRRLLLGFVAEKNQGTLARLSGTEQLLTKNIGEITKMSQLTRSGQPKQALAIFHKLPAELQKHKVFQLVAIHAAQGVSEEAYVAEMERFRQNHSSDPAADLLAIDYYLLKKQYDEMFKCIDRLDKAVGGDPYLDVLRASGFVQAGRYKEARAAAEKAVADAPAMPQGYQARITIATAENDHADTLTWLKKLVEATGTKMEAAGVNADPRFTQFRKTPQFAEFKQWLADRKK